MDTKRCTHLECLRELPISDFDFQAKFPEKLYAWCRSCRATHAIATPPDALKSIRAQEDSSLDRFIHNLRAAAIQLENEGHPSCSVCKGRTPTASLVISRKGKLEKVCRQCVPKTIEWNKVRKREKDFLFSGCPTG